MWNGKKSKAFTLMEALIVLALSGVVLSVASFIWLQVVAHWEGERERSAGVAEQAVERQVFCRCAGVGEVSLGEGGVLVAVCQGDTVVWGGGDHGNPLKF